jgi:hypothetical protein
MYQISNFQSEQARLNKEADLANREADLAKRQVSLAEQKVWEQGRKDGMTDQQIQADINRIKGK